MGISDHHRGRSTRLSALAGAGLLGVVLATAGCTFSELFRPDYYEVERGDTLYSIAWRHGLDWRDVAAWNDLSPPYKIKPGETLVLDRYAPVPYPEPDPKPGTTVKTQQPATERVRKTGSQTAKPAPPKADTAGRSQAASRGWRWPASGPVLRSYQQSKPRHGIDIGGEVGTPVRAAAAGHVVYSGSGLKGYGNLIIIKHDERYLSAYGFNRRLLVEQGDQVEAGQKVAEMGLGPRQKPMLHLEIRRDGQPVDPVGVLPRR